MVLLPVYQTATVADLAPLWEILKAVMLSITTMAALWTARTVFVVRDTVREVVIELRGVDGKNGLKSKVGDHETRLGKIEDRNLVLDALTEAERGQYTGKERRHEPLRKLLEMIRQEMEEERK